MAFATKIIATRRLQLHVKPLKGSTSPAMTAVRQCPSAVTRGIEVEARQASSNRSDFLRRSFYSRHAFASSLSIRLSKSLGVSFDHRRKPPSARLESFRQYPKA
jgi:ribosomal protein L13E